MKTIQRNTAVVSISLPRNIERKLDQIRKERGQSRSALIASLILKHSEEKRWQKIYKTGERTARQFKITSQEDIDRILHEA